MSYRSLASYPLEYLFCRVFGHSWEEFIAVGMRRPVTGFRLSLRCTSCMTERHDSIDTLGTVGSRKYYYPDNYYLGYTVPRSEARVVYNKRRRRKGMRREAV